MSRVEICHFSGYRIHPGHGKKVVKTDAKSFWIINGKVEKHFWDKKNPRKVPWTVVFRKIHKKGLVEETRKRRTRKQQKVTRAIVGASIELINKKRSIKPEQRKSDREAALRKAKEERKKAKEAKKLAKPAAAGKKADQRAQKTQKSGKGR